jgi:hypothetical protein
VWRGGGQDGDRQREPQRCRSSPTAGREPARHGTVLEHEGAGSDRQHDRQRLIAEQRETAGAADGDADITSAQTTTSVSQLLEPADQAGKGLTTAVTLPASEDVVLATVTKPTVSAHPANSTAAVGRRERLASEAEEKKRTVVRDPGSMRASEVPASVMQHLPRHGPQARTPHSGRG